MKCFLRAVLSTSPGKQDICGWEGGGNKSISIESSLELYPGFMEHGDAGKVAVPSIELVTLPSLSRVVLLSIPAA